MAVAAPQRNFRPTAGPSSLPKPTETLGLGRDRKRRRHRGRVWHSVWKGVVEVGGGGQTEELLNVTIERLGTDAITKSVGVVNCRLEVHAARDTGL